MFPPFYHHDKNEYKMNINVGES
eukprot:COSAG01_NODE_62480_length_284_cov_1.048649_1_plen_22_part_10